MKLKQFIFALVAMLLSFSVTTSAQQLLVNCDYNSSTEGFGVSKFSNYAGAYAYATANANNATIVIKKTNTLSGNTFDNNHKNYTRLAVVIKDGATMGNAASKWDMTYPVTVEPGGTLTCARPKNSTVSNIHIKNKLIVGAKGATKKAYVNFLSDSYQDCDISIRYNGSIEVYNADFAVQDLDAQGKLTIEDSKVEVDGAFASATTFYATTLTNTEMVVNGNQISGGLSDFSGGTSNQLGNVKINNSTLTIKEGDTKVAANVTATNSTIAVNNLIVNSDKTLNLNESSTLEAENITTAGTGSVKIDGVQAPIVDGAICVPVSDFTALKSAVEAGKNVQLTADITTTSAIKTSGVTSVIDLNSNKLTIGAGDNKFNDESNITIKNGTVSITGVTVGGNAIFCLDEYEKSLVTTVTLDNVNLVGEGYSSAYGIFYIGESSVLNVNGGEWNLKNDTHESGGVFKADGSGAKLNIDGLKLTAHNVRRVVTYAATTVENSTMAISGDADGVDAQMEHGFNRSPLAINNSTITMKDMVGRGITAQNGAVTISANSKVEMTNCQEATIDVRNNQTVTIDNTSTVSVDKKPTVASGSAINGTVKLPTVAKIGDVEYSDIQDALEATKTMTGDVTVEIYDKVTFNQPLIGNYTSIKFVGKDTDAEMYLDVQGYTTATGKKVSFTDLKLSKSEGGFIANAGFMNVAFGIYDVEEVTYNNCTFLNGACASSGKVTFNGCTFKKSWDKYGLWAYGNVDVTVQGSTFADYRGIKMYAENGADASVEKANLTVKNTNFSAVDNKPAIVLTYGESVVLEGNTYSSTGTFELDLDGKPNGVAVTSDVAPVCVNDNGACGVLVDGKIYTTVAQAAEVATSGSTVTLLHSSAETVALPMGVTLNKNNFEAAGVTVAGPVAKIGDVEYATLAAAINAAQNGETITLIDNVVLAERVTIPADKTLTIDLNGKSISMEESIIATAYAINNLGNLTITDGVGGGSINARGVYNGYGDGGANVATAKITVVNGTINAKGTNGGAAIFNYGIADIQGGNFTSIGGYSLNNQSGASMTIAAGVTANNGIYASGATLVVNGGEINGNRSGCHVLYAWNSNVTIAGGTFHNNNSGNSTTMAGGTTKLTIDGGTFSIANGKSTTGWTSCLIDATDGGKYEINGGEFKGHFRVQANCAMEINGGTFENTHGEAYVNGGTVAVKGGTFTDAAAQKFATDNLAAGYELGANGAVGKASVAEVNGVKYASFAEAAAAAQTGNEIKLLANIEGDITVPANVTLNGNGFVISGGILAEGDITFAGVTTAADFDANVVNTAVNIPAGASLQLTGTARLVIGHGATFNITGTIEDAKTADKATLVPSLKIAAGASITGNGVTFNVNNAYIVANANTTSKNSNANGTLDFNINNSIWDQTGVLAFYVPTSGKDPVVNFELKNSVLTTTSHLVFSVTKGEIVIDNSLVNQGASRQIENRSTMTIKNGSVVNGAVATSSNAINPGTIIVENATYAVTGEFSGAAEGTGTIIIKKGANVSVGSIKAGANVTVDAEGMAAGDEINFTANLSQFTGTLSVINNDKLEAKIVDGKVVLAAKPAAKIGEQGYATLEAAFAAATEGQTITLLDDATPALTSQRAITKAAVIDLGGKTMTLTEDDLYFGTTTFKNGTIVVDPSVKPSTAVFWMFENQVLTFEDVKLTATGVTGTYLIGLDGNNADLNLFSSEIIVDNTTALDLDIICVNASTGNDIWMEDSKVTVKNLDGRVFFRGNYTVKDSEVNLAGITKAGFRIEAGQTLSIEGTSKVNIEGEPRDGGIHLTDASANYTKAETATVNATVNEPKVAKIGETTYKTLQAAIEAVQEGETITVLEDITFTTGANGSTNGISYTRGASFTLDLNGKTITSNLGNNALRFKIGDGNTVRDTEVTVLIKNGKIVSGSNNWCAISAATADNSGNKLILNLTDLTIEANKAGDFAVKSWAGAVVNTNNVDVTSNYAGGFYAVGGEIVLDENSSVAQKGLHTEPYMSYAFGVSSGTGKMTVNGGTYSAVPAAASDGYNQGASHGSSVGGVMSSGGTLIINGGTFSNDNFGDAAPTAPRSLIMADAGAVVTINGGTFNAMAKIVDPTNNTGVASKNAVVTIAGGTYSADPTDAPYNIVKLAEDYIAVENNGVWTVVKAAAKIDKQGYATIKDAVAAVKESETITILAGTHSEGTIKLPATLKNVTIKGAEGAELKDMTISAADGNAYSYVGLTFDGITFDNSRILLTGWRNGDEIIENLAVTNCTFKNLDDNTNSAPIHINKEANEPVNGFTFTNNVIDGATGGSKSGIYAQVTGEVKVENNIINNVSFRPYVIQVTTDDGIADNFTVKGNTFSGSAAGRAQGLGNNAEGTDNVNLVVSNNIFKGITESQQICYWNFNSETTTADLSKNYYDIDIVANPSKIYFNSSAADNFALRDMNVFPIYTALNEDGTINTESAFTPKFYIAKVGENSYETLAEALADAKTKNLSDVVITIIGENTAATADNFALYDETVFNNVTFLQDNGGKTFYINELYTGSRNENGQFVFDGVNIVITGQYINQCKTVLKNNSMVKRSNDTKNFIMGDMVIEPGSKYDGQIDAIYAGSITVDGGKTDGTYNTEFDFKTIFFESYYPLVVKNGAYVIINAANEIGTWTLKRGVSQIQASKVEVFNTITLEASATLALDAKSVVYAKAVNGAGKITIDATGMVAGDVVNLNADFANFTGTLSVINNDKLDAQIVDGKVVLVAKPVAKIGDTYYATLEAALAAQGDEVELLATYEVAAGETKTLDLKGKTVIGTPVEAKAYAVIINKGNLTITGNGSVICNHTLAGSTGYAVNTITNGGTLTIDGATIENKSTAQYQIGYAIDNNSTTGDAIINIKAGKVIASGSSYYDGIRLFCNSITKKNDVIVSGGEVSTIWMQNPSDGAEKNTKDVAGNVEISGGTVGVLSLEPSANFEAAVTGGHIGEISYFQTAEGRDLVQFVTGGSFDNDVNQFCALGYQAKATAEGLYIVEYTGEVAEFTIVDGEYTEFNIETPIKVGTLTYERNFSAANRWNALYVPFEIPVELLTQAGYEVAYVNDVHSYDNLKADGTPGEDGVIDDMKMEVILIKNGKLNANYPYLIRANSAGLLSLEIENAKLYTTEEKSVSCSSVFMKFEVTGIYESKTAGELGDANSIYALGGGVWTLPESSNQQLKPFRLYLKATKIDGSPVVVDESTLANIRIRVAGEKDEVTGIITPIIEGDVHVNDGTVYDLMGRPVRTPEKGKIYIMNGKKVLF